MTAASHSAREESQARGNFPYLSGLSAQRKVEFLTLRVAPALAGGFIAYQHLLPSGQGCWSSPACSPPVMLMRRPRYPLHLIPLASAILYLLAPPLGALGPAWSVSRTGPEHRYARPHGRAGVRRLGRHRGRSAGSPIASGTDREVRVAVIGSHEFARGLRAELRGGRCQGLQGDRLHRSEGLLRYIGHVPASVASVLLCCCGSTVLDQAIELLVLGPSALPGRRIGQRRGVPPRGLREVADACLDLPVSLIESGQFYEKLFFGHVPSGPPPQRGSSTCSIRSTSAAGLFPSGYSTSSSELGMASSPPPWWRSPPSPSSSTGSGAGLLSSDPRRGGWQGVRVAQATHAERNADADLARRREGDLRRAPPAAAPHQ